MHSLVFRVFSFAVMSNWGSFLTTTFIGCMFIIFDKPIGPLLAIGVFLAGDCLDAASTYIVMKKLSIDFEGNPFVRKYMQHYGIGKGLLLAFLHPRFNLVLGFVGLIYFVIFVIVFFYVSIFREAQFSGLSLLQLALFTMGVDAVFRVFNNAYVLRVVTKRMKNGSLLIVHSHE